MVLTAIGFVVMGFLSLVLILLLVRYRFFCKTHKNIPDMETVRERLLAVNHKEESDVDVVFLIRNYFACRRYKKAYKKVQKEREFHAKRAARSVW